MNDSYSKIADEVATYQAPPNGQYIQVHPRVMRDWEARLRALESQRGGGVLVKVAESLALIEIQATNFALAPSVGGVNEKAVRDCMLRLSAALRAEQDFIRNAITTPELPDGEAAAEQYRKAHNAGEAHGRIMAALESSQPAAVQGWVMVPRARLEAIANILGGARLTTSSGLPSTAAEEIDVQHAAASELRELLAAAPQPAAVQGGRWPFVESPGEFTARLEAAMREFPLIGAVRHVLIENPPTLAAAQGGMTFAFMAEVCDAAVQAMQANGLIKRTIRLQEVRDQLRHLAAAPQPQEHAGAAHQWSADGERCEVCGDKDWMGGPCVTPPASGGVDSVCVIRLGASDWNPYELLDIARLHVPTKDQGDALLLDRIHECLRQQRFTQTSTPSPTSARELPELPKPSKRERHWDGEIVSEWFTADQMRAYALQAREGK